MVECTTCTSTSIRPMSSRSTTAADLSDATSAKTMAWLELSLIIAAGQQANVESALEDLGALAVTLLDAEDHPIFEPAPGETPLWPQIAMSALFEPDRDRAGLVHVLTDLVPDL